MSTTAAKFYWLISGQVVTVNTRRGIENTKNLNVVTITEDVRFTRADIAKSQDAMMRRFVSECVQIPGFKITDAFIHGFGLLGHMTHEEFNAGFVDEVSAAGGMH